ncbi:TPA: hypothetical protein DCP77_02590 [Candidatus Collierbacteria bacterium]|uniref:Uncharacterized protein n=1 Tax=Candidatus Collierbacteria bacterium GW2011_GWA2_42_17 TaxID=1618378 RepID=A0A0G0Z3Z0_9BACT|nr:MAG: hypothetical protein UU94_C0001G0044 [Candidatus Collierbacteria bacterium GW2011_GWB2_42_12]KKS43455.1 MAG: hypothetical protein UV06_C0001G0189 [Candidatus Collierbacteria bacterium GW2011_GWA2_42_17]KKS62474.1 MAG: hypothetical protein UV28_C0010G0033 [Candidatus Collierbacteria bacterium GW2011_GWE2_42_48]KKS67569.1 MAG: hypothetical protein UV37_C0004G0006 [Candidatus Collierbacteria bacterium GW2011_GWA1_42_60]HAI22874.1 hypothetical protein [Candidatus Collierbacteria bacterium]
MLRRLAPILTIIFFIFISLFFVPKINAEETLPALDDIITKDNTLDKTLQDFCAKRSGNQMNLETWYSGKCTADTFSGEGIGFSDIVILDLAEKIYGQKDPKQTFSKTLKGILDAIKLQGYNTPEEQKLAIDYARQKLISNQNTGLIGQSGKMISLLFQNQPVSTKSYLAHVTQNLQKHKVIPSALAATSPGTGFNTFSPFLNIWIAVRNLAYLILVVFFIVYGFMMMFRVNLGQKTVITVQLAIPKLIITLLIITFSYAIVGLIYDLMWVIIYFIFGYLESQNITVLGYVGDIAKFASGNSWGGMVGSFILNSAIAGPVAIPSVLNLIFGGIGEGLGILVSFTITGVLIMLVLIIAVLISYGKLFLKLIGAFISVVISLIIGPIILLGNALPGSTAIGTWFRGIVANLAVFPVTMLFLLFSYILMIQPLIGTCTDIIGPMRTFFQPGSADEPAVFCERLYGVRSLVDGSNIKVTGIPLIAPPLVGFDARGLLALLGIGLLLMASKYVDMVRDSLKVAPFKYGSALSENITTGREVYSGAKKAITELSSKPGSGSLPPGAGFGGNPTPTSSGANFGGSPTPTPPGAGGGTTPTPSPE